MDCEIILLVEDLDLCRYFYRNTVALGEPEVDSNFTVVFRIGEKSTLVLEKCSSTYLAHGSSSCRFTIFHRDIGTVMKNMRDNDTPLTEGFARSGNDCYQGTDPEGNVFYLCRAD